MREIESLKTQYRVSDFITWQRDKLLVLNPNFQRRSVWKSGAKSYLIDTIIKGLPIPIIFLRDLRADLRTFKSQRDVVDGQQRLRTIITYIAPHLLDDYVESRDAFVISKSHSAALAGKGFAELPESARQRILDYQFSVHSFNADTDDKEILQIFARMNSSGYKLNAQELRNAEFFGEFKQVSYDLAFEQLNRWMDWSVFSNDQISRMSEVEFTSELFILILQGLTAQSKARIDRYYEEYDEEFSSKQEVIIRFKDVMNVIENYFEKAILKKYFGSKTLFYALFCAIYELRYGLRDGKDVRKSKTEKNCLAIYQEKLGKERGKTLTQSPMILHAAVDIEKGLAPQPVQRALRGATGDLGSRREIVQFLLGRKIA